MANWSRKKVFALAKGFRGRSKNCFGIALRKVHRASQYAYRDRRTRRRNYRREWISTINAAVREHGVPYSRFAHCLVKKTNIELDRKILSNLAVNEPYSFKCVIDEVRLQSSMMETLQRKPVIQQMTGVSFDKALEQGFLKMEKRRPDEIQHIIEAPKAQLYGLRFPDRDAKTERDYMRLSFKEEDELFLKEQSRLQLTDKEQKRLPREVLADDWKEDMSMYNNKRKP